MAQVRAYLGPNIPVWVSEGSPNWKASGDLNSNLTFELVNVDMMGSFAQAGISVYGRQCLNSIVGPKYVRPGFWVSLLWKQLMGTTVVHASLSAAAKLKGL